MLRWRRRSSWNRTRDRYSQDRSCCCSFAVNDGADRLRTLQIDTAVAEAHAGVFEHANGVAQKAVGGFGGRVARAFPGADRVVAQAGTLGQLTARETRKLASGSKLGACEQNRHVVILYVLVTIGNLRISKCMSPLDRAGRRQ